MDRKIIYSVKPYITASGKHSKKNGITIIVNSVGRNFHTILIHCTQDIQRMITIIGYAQVATMILRKCLNGRLMKPNKKNPDRYFENLSGVCYGGRQAPALRIIILMKTNLYRVFLRFFLRKSCDGEGNVI